jgi:hypothetical protein
MLNVSEVQSSKNRSLIIYLIFTAVVTCIVYLPSLNNDFVTWDDNIYVYNNEMIRNVNLRLIQWAFASFEASNWHPLTWLSHAFDYALWKLNPIGHHLTSILLHSINALLVTLLTVRLIETLHREKKQSFSLTSEQKVIVGLTTGLLFGIHPLHVESVAWVSERKDVLSTLFFLLSILFYLRYSSRTTGKGHFLFLNKHYLASFVSFVLGLLSKPMIVTLPLILLLLDWYPLKRFDRLKSAAKTLIEKIPFFICSFASIIVTVIAQRQAISDFEVHPLSLRIANAFKSFSVYLQKIVWPADFMPFYPYQIRVNLFSFEYILSLLVFLSITIGCIILWKKKNQHFWLASWIYYVVTLLPVIGIVQIGRQEMADRYMYLPSIGPFILLGIFAGMLYAILVKRNMITKLLTGLMVVVVIALLSSKTVAYIGIWKDGISLWNHEIRLLQQKTDRGFYRESLEVPFFNRGVAFEEKESFEKAIQDYTTVLSINAKSKKALHRRGLTYSKMNMNEEAIKDYNSALQLASDDPALHYLRANSYAKLGHYQKALDDYSMAIQLNTEPLPEYYMMRGIVFKIMGRQPESNADFKQAELLQKNE